MENRLVLIAPGGVEILGGAAHMAIGKHNRVMMRKLLRKMSLQLAVEDTGGSIARAMSLNLQTGEVCACANGDRRVLWQGSAEPTRTAE